MASASKYRLWNFDDFCALIPEGQKADLIDGVIYVASPDNIEHYRLNTWLARLLEDYLEAKKLGGEIFGTRIAFRLDDDNSPEPDVAYVRSEKIHSIEKTLVRGAPDLAVEIVSPDSVERDYEKKKALYEKFRVPEYWIIDPLETRMLCFRLSREGKYREIKLRKGVCVSSVVPGFWVRAAWFWHFPLPPRTKVLKEILADSLNGH